MPSLMGLGDVSQLTLLEIYESCKIYSHGQAKISKGTRDTNSKFSKLVISKVTRYELGNLLAKFKFHSWYSIYN